MSYFTLPGLLREGGCFAEVAPLCCQGGGVSGVALFVPCGLAYTYLVCCLFRCAGVKVTRISSGCGGVDSQGGMLSVAPSAHLLRCGRARTYVLFLVIFLCLQAWFNFTYVWLLRVRVRCSPWLGCGEL